MNLSFIKVFVVYLKGLPPDSHTDFLKEDRKRYARAAAVSSLEPCSGLACHHTGSNREADGREELCAAKHAPIRLQRAAKRWRKGPRRLCMSPLCTARPAFRRSPCASELASGKEDADENGRGDRVCAAMRDWDERLRLPAQWLPCAAYLRPRGRIVALHTMNDEGASRFVRRSVTLRCTNQFFLHTPPSLPAQALNK